ncbi:predicted protein [Nematostella vectensis]|uniref:Uncharacterized protein n=1 Tax=Nematostella vectensis TaxID=45351 RepID=A7SF37_NEMVE|nr:predicted protein [Nematostella vectensis]|eukprot:XP_001629770.1 predicted protein [Nematostella vectensis]
MNVAASKTPSKEVALEKREQPQPLSQAIEVDFPLETIEQEKQFVDVHGRIIKTIITRSVIRTWIVFDEEGNPVQDTNAPESEELPTDCELEDVSDEQGHVVRRIVKRYIVVKSLDEKPLKMNVVASKTPSKEVAPEKREQPQPLSQAIEVDFPLETSEQEKQFVDVHGRIIKTIITRSVIRTWIVFDEKGNHVQDKNAPESEELPTDCELEDVSDEQGRVVRRIVKRYIVIKVFIINQEGQLEEIDVSPEERETLLQMVSTDFAKTQSTTAPTETREVKQTFNVMPVKKADLKAFDVSIPEQSVEREGSDQQSVETRAEEFTDQHGRIVRHVVTRVTICTWVVVDKQGRPVSDPKAPSLDDIPPDCVVEEYTDDLGRTARRIVKRTIHRRVFVLNKHGQQTEVEIPPEEDIKTGPSFVIRPVRRSELEQFNVALPKKPVLDQSIPTEDVTVVPIGVEHRSRPIEGDPITSTVTPSEKPESKILFNLTPVKKSDLEAFQVAKPHEREVKEIPSETQYEEYVEETGRTVRERRTVTTKRTVTQVVKSPGSVPQPGDQTLMGALASDIDIEGAEVEDYVDEEGRRVRRLVRRTVVTNETFTSKSVPAKADSMPGQKLQPFSIQPVKKSDLSTFQITPISQIPSSLTEKLQPETKYEEYVDEHGQIIRRTTKVKHTAVKQERTTVTKTVTRDGVTTREANVIESPPEVESSTQVYRDEESSVRDIKPIKTKEDVFESAEPVFLVKKPVDSDRTGKPMEGKATQPNETSQNVIDEDSPKVLESAEPVFLLQLPKDNDDIEEPNVEDAQPVSTNVFDDIVPMEVERRPDLPVWLIDKPEQDKQEAVIDGQFDLDITIKGKPKKEVSGTPVLEEVVPMQEDKKVNVILFDDHVVEPHTTERKRQEPAEEILFDFSVVPRKRKTPSGSPVAEEEFNFETAIKTDFTIRFNDSTEQPSAEPSVSGVGEVSTERLSSKESEPESVPHKELGKSKVEKTPEKKKGKEKAEDSEEYYEDTEEIVVVKIKRKKRIPSSFIPYDKPITIDKPIDDVFDFKIQTRPKPILQRDAEVSELIVPTEFVGSYSLSDFEGLDAESKPSEPQPPRISQDLIQDVRLTTPKPPPDMGIYNPAFDMLDDEGPMDGNQPDTTEDTAHPRMSTSVIAEEDEEEADKHIYVLPQKTSTEVPEPAKHFKEEIQDTHGKDDEEVEEFVEVDGKLVRRIVRHIFAKPEGVKVIDGDEFVDEERIRKDKEDPEEEFEEFVDEGGRVLRRIVRRTVPTKTLTTRTVTSDQASPEEMPTEEVFLSAEPVKGTEVPEEGDVEEFVDEEGRIIRRIVKRTVVTKRIVLRPGEDTPETVEMVIPMEQGELKPGDEDEVEEFVDEEGRKVRRIVRRTTSTKTVVLDSGETLPINVMPDQPKPVVESAEPVSLDKLPVDKPDEMHPEHETISATETESKPQLPDWLEQVKDEPHKPVDLTEGDVSEPEEKEKKTPPKQTGVPVSEDVVASSRDRTEPLPDFEDVKEPEKEFEEFVDEEGRVVRRRIVRRTVTTKTLTTRTVTSDQAGPEETPTKEVLESAEPVKGTEVPEEGDVEEFVDEKGRIVRRIVKRTVVTKRIVLRPGEDTPETVEMAIPIEQGELKPGDEDEVEEFVDEEGRKVRRIVRRTTSTKTVVLDSGETLPINVMPDQPKPVVESAEPVSLDKLPVDKPDEMHPEDETISATETESKPQLPDWLEQVKDEPHKPVDFTEGDVSEPEEGEKQTPPKQTGVPVSEDVVASSRDRTEPLPDFEDVKEPGEEFEEFVDEEGRVVRRIVRRTVTTKTVTTRTVTSDQAGPEEMPTEEAFLSAVPVEGTEVPEEGDVEEFVDEEGRIIRRIVKRTVVTKRIVLRPGEDTPETVEMAIPIEQGELKPGDEDEVEEFVDEEGRKVRRIVRRTTSTKTVVLDSGETLPINVMPDQPKPVVESAEPVSLDKLPVDKPDEMHPEDETISATETEGKPQLPDWLEQVKDEPHKPVGFTEGDVSEPEEEEKQTPSQPTGVPVSEDVVASSEDKDEPLPDFEDVKEPEEEFEEFVDEEGRVVRRIVRRTVTTKTVTTRTVTSDQAGPEEMPTEEGDVEEFVDEKGRIVRRIVKRTVVTKRIVLRPGEDTPETVEMAIPIEQGELKPGDEDEVEEFVDEEGRKVRRIVRRTTSTKTVVLDSGETLPINVMPDQPKPVVESAEPVSLDKLPVDKPDEMHPEDETISATETESKPQLPDWLEPVKDEPHKPVDFTEGDVSELEEGEKQIPSQPTGVPVSEDVVASSEDKDEPLPDFEDVKEPEEEFQEFVDEEGRVVKRRIVRRTVTTKTLTTRTVTSDQAGPEEMPTEEVLESAEPVKGTEVPEEGDVEEFVDEEGRIIRRIVKRTVVTKRIIGPRAEDGFDMIMPLEGVSMTPEQGDEQIEEFVDDKGRTVRRIVQTTTSQIVKTQSYPVDNKNVCEAPIKSVISARTVPLDNTRKVSVEKVDPLKVALPPIVFESGEPVYLEKEPLKEQLEGHPEMVVSTVQVDACRPQTEERVDEYIDEKGNLVKKITKHFVSSRTILHHPVSQEDQVSPPVELTKEGCVFETAPAVSHPASYVDEDGRVWATKTSPLSPSFQVETFFRPEDQPFSIMEIERSATDPEEYVEEFVDEEGRQVKRVIKKYVTTKTIVRSRKGDGGKMEILPEEDAEKEQQKFPEASTAAIVADVETKVFEEPQSQIRADEVLFSGLNINRSKQFFTQTTITEHIQVIEEIYLLVVQMRSQIVSHAARYQQFDFVLEDLLQWLLDMEKRLTSMQPVSWRLEDLVTQQLASQKLNDEFQEHKPIIENFNHVSDSLLQHAAPEDREGLEREVNGVKGAAADVERRLAEREKTEEMVRDRSRRYDDAKNGLAEVVHVVDLKLGEQHAYGAEPDGIRAELRRLEFGGCGRMESEFEAWDEGLGSECSSDCGHHGWERAVAVQPSPMSSTTPSPLAATSSCRSTASINQSEALRAHWTQEYDENRNVTLLKLHKHTEYRHETSYRKTDVRYVTFTGPLGQEPESNADYFTSESPTKRPAKFVQNTRSFEPMNKDNYIRTSHRREEPGYFKSISVWKCTLQKPENYDDSEILGPVDPNTIYDRSITHYAIVPKIFSSPSGPSKVLKDKLYKGAAAAESAGQNLLSLEGPDADLSGVDEELRALNERVSDLKVRLSAFEEHYQDHLQQAEAFQDAVRRLLDRLAARKALLDRDEVDTSDKNAVRSRIAELEVRSHAELLRTLRVI